MLLAEFKSQTAWARRILPSRTPRFSTVQSWLDEKGKEYHRVSIHIQAGRAAFFKEGYKQVTIRVCMENEEAAHLSRCRKAWSLHDQATMNCFICVEKLIMEIYWRLMNLKPAWAPHPV